MFTTYSFTLPHEEESKLSLPEIVQRLEKKSQALREVEKRDKSAKKTLEDISYRDESDYDDYCEEQKEAKEETRSLGIKRDKLEEEISSLKNLLPSTCRESRNEEIKKGCVGLLDPLLKMISHFDGEGYENDQAKIVDLQSILTKLREQAEAARDEEEAQEAEEINETDEEETEEIGEGGDEEASYDDILEQHMQGLEEEAQQEKLIEDMAAQQEEEEAHYLSIFEQSQNSTQSLNSPPEAVNTEATAREVDSTGKPTYPSQSSSSFYSAIRKKRKTLSTNDNQSDDKNDDDNSEPLSKKLKA